MVGTRRTNACETCRRRRVKCDEVRPVCGQCAIKGRDCTESPPPRVIWARNGQLFAENASTSLPGGNTAPSISEVDKSMRLVHPTTVHGDGVVHKYCPSLNVRHSGDSLSAVGMSHIDKLRCQFLDAYLRGPPGLRLSGYNPLLDDLPRYLGESKALDDSLSCLIRTRDLRSNGKAARGTAAYLTAIRSLQESLNKPAEASRGTTLCAITLLTWTEVLGEERMDKAYVQHVGGLSTVIKLLGPSCVQNSLAKDVTLGAVGSIIMDAIMKNQPCFLNEPQWSWIFCDDSSHDERRRLFIRILQNFSFIASLIVHVRSACRLDDCGSTVQYLFEKAVQLRSMIHGAKDEIDLLLSAEGLETRQLEQQVGRAPITSTYWFKDPSTARAAIMSWALSIYVNNIVICLMHFLGQACVNVSAVVVSQGDLQVESAGLGKRIFMSTVYVAQFAPVGSTYMRLPIYIAWGTLSSEYQDWAVGELHRLNAGLVVDYHTPAVLNWTSRYLCGWDMISSDF